MTPDRDKLAKLIWMLQFNSYTWEEMVKNRPDLKKRCFQIAKELIALFPDVKHDMVRCPNCGAEYMITYDNMVKTAKREERDRLLKDLMILEGWATPEQALKHIIEALKNMD